MHSLRYHAASIALLLLICALAGGFKLGDVGTTPNSDYESYIATAQVIAGHGAPVYPQRLLKPLAPALVALAAPLAGYPVAFLLEVLIFYFAFALVFYALAWSFFEDRALALSAALLGALSYPILRYGLDLYTESGAQFFYILSLLLTLLYIRAPSRRLLIGNALTIGIGLLWKEYSVVSGLIFGLVLLLESGSVQAKGKNLALLALCSLLPTALVQLWVYSAYHYTYFSWYLAGGASGFATQFTAHNIIKSVAALLGLAWLLVPLGAWYAWELSPAQRRFLLVAVLPAFVCLLWGYVSSRLFYVLAPGFVLLAAWGLARLPRPFQTVAIVLIIAANLAWLTLAMQGASV